MLRFSPPDLEGGEYKFQKRYSSWKRKKRDIITIFYDCDCKRKFKRLCQKSGINSFNSSIFETLTRTRFDYFLRYRPEADEPFSSWERDSPNHYSVYKKRSPVIDNILVCKYTKCNRSMYVSIGEWYTYIYIYIKHSSYYIPVFTLMYTSVVLLSTPESLQPIFYTCIIIQPGERKLTIFADSDAVLINHAI